MKGNFLWAVSQMKEGKKVTRDNKRLFQLADTNKEIIQIVTRDNEKAVKALLMEDYEATDWELIEETMTLSDELYEEMTDYNNEPNKKGDIVCKAEKVKQFIKDIKEDIDFPESVVEPQIAKEIIKVINERAGERLI